MPERMAADLIRTWSDVGDLVFDPSAGAGTTLKMALLSYRRYLGAHHTTLRRSTRFPLLRLG
jgi:DNA modification methylase